MNSINSNNGIGSIFKSPVKNDSLSSTIGDAVELALNVAGDNKAGALKNLGNLFQDIGEQLSSSHQSADVAHQSPLATPVAKLIHSIGELFGNSAFAQQANDDKAKAKAAAGGAISLGALLAMIGGTLVTSINTTMQGLQQAAQQLDAQSKNGGPTAAMNQKIQELTFNLQQIQQSINNLNSSITSLSKSQNDTQKETAQNLRA